MHDTQLTERLRSTSVTEEREDKVACALQGCERQVPFVNSPTTLYAVLSMAGRQFFPGFGGNFQQTPDFSSGYGNAFGGIPSNLFMPGPHTGSSDVDLAVCK